VLVDVDGTDDPRAIASLAPRARLERHSAPARIRRRPPSPLGIPLVQRFQLLDLGMSRTSASCRSRPAWTSAATRATSKLFIAALRI